MCVKFNQIRLPISIYKVIFIMEPTIGNERRATDSDGNLDKSIMKYKK